MAALIPAGVGVPQGTGMHPAQKKMRRATRGSLRGSTTAVVVAGAETRPAPQRNRGELGSRPRGVPASALGC